MSNPVWLDLEAPAPACDVRDGCITCGDVAVDLVVVRRLDEGAGAADAVCRDEWDRTEVVATELVGPVQPGDHLLVHAGVALERLRGART
jgi:hypothetical protein